MNLWHELLNFIEQLFSILGTLSQFLSRLNQTKNQIIDLKYTSQTNCLIYLLKTEFILYMIFVFGFSFGQVSSLQINGEK